jgi:hypothetical protein
MSAIASSARVEPRVCISWFRDRDRKEGREKSRRVVGERVYKFSNAIVGGNGAIYVFFFFLYQAATGTMPSICVNDLPTSPSLDIMYS